MAIATGGPGVRKIRLELTQKLAERVNPAQVRRSPAEVLRALADACEYGLLNTQHVKIDWDVQGLDELRVAFEFTIVDGPYKAE